MWAFRMFLVLLVIALVVGFSMINAQENTQQQIQPATAMKHQIQERTARQKTEQERTSDQSEVRAGEHHYNLAWGHGGQQIALLDELDLVVVAVADPLYGQHGDAPWKLEKANLNLVADFIAAFPAPGE